MITNIRMIDLPPIYDEEMFLVRWNEKGVEQEREFLFYQTALNFYDQLLIAAEKETK